MTDQQNPLPPAQQPDPLTNSPDNSTPMFDLGVGMWSNVGLMVFLAAALGAVVVVVMLIILGGGTEIDYRIFRGLEIILSVAALGLIATLMGKTANVFALIIGFLVISALVIPTRDLVRITLIASGSDKSLDHYYGSAGVASNLTNDVTDTSSRVIDAIEKTVGPTLLSNAYVDMLNLREAIESELQRDRMETLLQRIKARGILELFEAVASNETEAFLYRHSQNDRLLPDLQFLRYEGLISIAYDDVATAEISELGRNVLDVQRGLTEQASIITASAVNTFQSRLPVCGEINATTIGNAEEIELTNFPISISINGAGLPRYFKVRLLGGDVGAYTFSHDAPDSVGYDPLMSLMAYDGNAARSGILSDCVELVYDDDGRAEFVTGSLNSVIQTLMEPGYYLIGLGALDGAGPGTFIIEKE